MLNIDRYEKSSIQSKILHRKAASYYSKLNTVLNVTNILLVTLISISNNITSISQTNNSYISIIYSIFLYISAFMTTLKQFFKFEELAEKHRISSTRYNHLYNLIQLSEKTSEQVRNIIEEFENIYNSSPSIPEKIQIPEKEDIEIQTEKNSEKSLSFSEIDKATAHQLSRLIVQSYNIT